MFDLKPLFFVVCRLTAHFFVVSRTAKETVIRNEDAFSWESCPRLFGKGIHIFCFPEMGAGVSKQPVVLLNTFGWLQQRGKPPRNGRILFRELRPPFPEQGHTQSGLRADTPTANRGFQGSPKTRPDHS